jgi:hypothetical protein
MSMFDLLAAEFPRDAVHWRAQTMTAAGDKALALAYIDARDVMDRLDEVCGPDAWQDSYTETAKGRVICTISIRMADDTWVAKADGAGDTDVEGDKGGLSDAFKRAAVKWGIGRYLYRLPTVWAPCEHRESNGKKYWKAWKGSPWDAMRGGPAPKPKPDPTPDTPTGPINDRTRDWLASLIDGSLIPVGEVCQRFTISSLKEVTYENLNEVRAWINANKKVAA